MNPRPLQSLNVATPLGTMVITCNAEAITRVYWASDHAEPSSPGADSCSLLADCADQLKAYFAGQRRRFDLPLAPQGTPFQQQVWGQMMTVNHGDTSSYGALAKQLAKPSAARAVGAAVGKNPLLILQPCHRIVAANGGMTGYVAGLRRKQWLLAHEAGR